MNSVINHIHTQVCQIVCKASSGLLLAAVDDLKFGFGSLRLFGLLFEILASSDHSGGLRRRSAGTLLS